MNRRATKPGEWWLIGAFSLLLIAPVLYFITAESEAEVAAIAERGIVAQATVTNKTTREHQHTNRKGHTTTTTSYILSVSYDAMSTNSYADWLADKPYVAPRYAVKSSWELEVTHPTYDAAVIGDDTMIAMLPNDLSSMEMAQEVRDLQSGWQNIIQKILSFVAGALGLFMGFMGVRARLGK